MGVGVGGAVSGSQSLADLVATVERFAAAFRPADDPTDLGAQLVLLRSTMDRVEVMFSHAAATFAATDEYENQGATTPIEWVRHNCRMGRAEAARRVVVGEHIQHMPALVESLFEGRVGFGHLVHAAAAARKLTESRTGAGFDEADLLERAEGMSVGAFYFAVQHYIHAQDPKGSEKDDRDAAETRELYMTQAEDGSFHLSADLDAEGGAVVRTALEALARPTGAGDDRLVGQRLADALVECLRHAMDIGAMPTRGGQRVHVQVNASYDTLKASLYAPAAYIDFSLPISGSKARRLACDCNLTRVLLNSDSAPSCRDGSSVQRDSLGTSRFGGLEVSPWLPSPPCGWGKHSTSCPRETEVTHARVAEITPDGGERYTLTGAMEQGLRWCARG